MSDPPPVDVPVSLTIGTASAMTEAPASRALALLARWAARRARRLAEEPRDSATVVELASYSAQNPEKRLAATHTGGNMP